MVGVVLSNPPAGGASVSGAVEGEIARRQAQMFAAEKLVVEGDDLMAAGDYAEAVARYASAYNGLTPSPTSTRMRDLARDRFAVASTKRAMQLIEAAEFAEAERVIDRVLDPAVAPDYTPARKIKSRLADPEWYNRARTPEHQEKVAEVQRLLVLAEGAMRIGDFDKASGHYASVLRIDKYNTAARRGMEEVEHHILGYQKSARDHTRNRMLRQVEGAWESQVVEISDAFGIGEDRGGAVPDTVEQKLYSTVIENVEFDDASLEDVVQYLTLKSQQADITGEGINFVLRLEPGDEAARNARVNLRLRNVPIGVVLKHVTRDTGTHFHADAFAVRITSQAYASQALVTKRFRVPPDFLDTAAVGGGAAEVDDPFAATPEAPGRGLQVRRLGPKEVLMQHGVTFPDGATAFMGKGQTMLVVRNTQGNLDLIEAVVDSMYQEVPKQLEIRVTMIDVATNELNEIGFDWLLGQFNVPGSSRVFGGGGTFGNSATTGATGERSSEYTFIPPGAGEVPLGTHPLTAGLRSGRQWNEGDSINSLLLQGGAAMANPASLKAPGVFGVGGAFTDPQFQVVMRGLSQLKGADVLTRPSIVTRSGQRAVVDIIREFPYPTEYDPPEIPQTFDGGGVGGGGGGGLGGVGAASVESFPVTPAHPTAFEVRPVGTHLEVEPVVGPDGYTVELNLSPELVQFEGFINYGSPITTAATNALGQFQNLPLTDNRILQPVFRTTRENTSVVVWDGATVVIGGLYEERSQQVEDSVPLLGDAPLFGRFFRSKGVDRIQRAVMIFVRVDVIDPSGGRVNARPQ